MAHDTRMGEFKVPCDDCGREDKVVFEHWGPFVPPGTVGHFCGICFNGRKRFFEENGKPKPLNKGEQ